MGKSNPLRSSHPPRDSRNKLPAPMLSSPLSLLLPTPPVGRTEGTVLAFSFVCAKALSQFCIRNCHNTAHLPLHNHFISLRRRGFFCPISWVHTCSRTKPSGQLRGTVGTKGYHLKQGSSACNTALTPSYNFGSESLTTRPNNSTFPAISQPHLPTQLQLYCCRQCLSAELQ